MIGDFKGLRPLARPYDLRDKERTIGDYVLYMLSRTQSMFKYDGLPDTIPARDLELLLQVNGFAGIAEVDGELYAFYGGLGGRPNPYYMPTILTVANPALNFNKTLTIDEDVIIIRGDSMYHGLMPLFSRYATLLTEADITLSMFNNNMRIPRIISGSDNNTIESAKRFFKDIEDGRNGIVAENAFLDGIKTEDYGGGSGYRVTDVIEYRQYLLANWYNELGLQSNYNMKRERLGDEEIQSNEAILLPLVDDMLRCREMGVESVNKKYGTEITVKLASSWQLVDKELEAEAGEEGETDDENENANQSDTGSV